MLVYGKNVVASLLDNNTKIKKAYVNKDFKEREITNSLNCPIKYVDNNYLDRLVDGLHQGIVVEIDDYKYQNIIEYNKNFKLLNMKKIVDKTRKTRRRKKRKKEERKTIKKND